ncbi:MAG: hypothetical protein ACI8QZ_003843 [Chlamydiales bacterium]|jgi:hypothetical protein
MHVRQFKYATHPLAQAADPPDETMSITWLKNALSTGSGSFYSSARAKGLPGNVIRLIEQSAREISPERPERVLTSRDLFERAALRVIVGDAGNLELTFGRVDELATAIETLDLARQVDVPDPFRRVWVNYGDKQRLRGVVLSYRGGELAVVAPPGKNAISGVGNILNLSYRGSSSDVAYDLQLVDAVRLPNAFVMHMTRIAGQGAIGRVHTRWPVHIHARMTLVDGGPEPQPCEVLNLSSGGVRMDCALDLKRGCVVELEFALGGESDELFRARALVRWKGNSSEDRHSHGLEFEMLPEVEASRLDAFVRAAAVVA